MYIQDTSIETVVEQIKQLPRTEHDTVFMLIGEHSIINISDLLDALKDQHIPVTGGIFPGVIYGNQKYETGIVATTLPMIAEPSIITGLDTPNFELSKPQFDRNTQQYTALILVDGLTKYIAMFLDKLFQQLDNTVSYIGGGAGSLSFQQKPCVFDSHGIYQDAAIILWVKASTKLGVRHGWQNSRGPHIATRTEGNVVYELDRKPAFEFYSQFIKMKTRQTITHENFFDIAKEYPLGIYHPGVDRIVRDPITFTEDGGLVCVGEVPMNTMVYILQGNKQHLIADARRAATEATEQSHHNQHNFIVDCISRVLFLEDDFNKELEAVADALPDGTSKPFGVLSLGEIGTYGTGRVEFFNKTMVVGVLNAI